MKTKILIIAIIAFFAGSCGQVRKLKNIKNCELKLSGIVLQKLDDMDVSGIRSAADIDMLTAGKLLMALFSEKSMLQYTVQVAVKNPNEKPAMITKMELIVYYTDTELGRGEVTKSVEIKSGGEAVVPVSMVSDIAGVAKNTSRKELLSLLFPREGGISPVFKVKVKPTFSIGGNSVKYPGYITLTTDFKDK